MTNKFELIPVPDHEAVIERIAAQALEEARKPVHDHEAVIERIAAEALAEARKAAKAARRSIGQRLRRDREKHSA